MERRRSYPTAICASILSRRGDNGDISNETPARSWPETRCGHQTSKGGAMARPSFSLISFLLRWLVALVLVFATFNPTDYSYYRWVVGLDAGMEAGMDGGMTGGTWRSRCWSASRSSSFT